MADNTFDELRKLAEDGTDLPVKSMLRLIMARLADMHDSAEEARARTDKRLERIEIVVKYPSLHYYLATHTLKTLGWMSVGGLIVAMVVSPDVRGWAFENILKVFLGGL